MKTIGLIGAGQIGSQIARLATAHGYRVWIGKLAWAGNPVSARCRARTNARAGGGCRRRKGGDIVVVTVPLKNYRHGPVEPLAGKVDRHETNYYHNETATSNSRQRVDDHLGAPAGAPADLEGRQGIQPHLRRITTDGKRTHENRPCSFIAGDDPAAKATVTELLDHSASTRTPPLRKVAYPA